MAPSTRKDSPNRSSFPLTYRSYEKDIEYIAGWLAWTSERCGYLRADSESRAQHDAGKPASKSGKRAKHPIRIVDFVKMAKFIASSDSKPDVPGALQNVFDRVIAARSEMAGWFENGHKVTAISLNLSTQEIPAVLDDIKLQNKSSGLMVEETDPLDELIVEVKENQLPNINPCPIELDEKDLEEEFFFAIGTFLNDIYRVRAYLIREWDEYRQTGKGLARTAAISNTAIDLVRSVEHEFDQMLVRPNEDVADWVQILDVASEHFKTSLAVDEATHGIKHMMTSEEIPIWVTVVIQVHFDVEMVLKNKNTLTGPSEDYQKSVREAAAQFAKIDPTKRPFLKHLGAAEDVGSYYKDMRNTIKEYRKIALENRWGEWLKREVVEDHVVLGKVAYERDWYMVKELNTGHENPTSNLPRNKQSKQDARNVKQLRRLEDPSVMGALFMERLHAEPESTAKAHKWLTKLSNPICKPESQKILDLQENLPEGTYETSGFLRSVTSQREPLALLEQLRQ
ncbi:hypothetical protein ACET3X_008675 [Alternaria dauci]|uniref:DUF6604 domain-containing protein n=1 Tax=Alternaria dauci TaxID=48095 RepID=A0ABR3UCK7_9PLEO